uniref:Uncharacterized protein n=1 Tax=Siphoviridae sp. ctmP19 TaxID=2825651 RepID=A0A8S5PIB5_9CAUD|nr:MAG TPA: hypothetical protein [Siphoviridae sp. ctmP19]
MVLLSYCHFYDAGRLVLSGVVNVFCNLLVSLVVLKV